jgi:RimJ/RimL family protein N-acetyltransferase
MTTIEALSPPDFPVVAGWLARPDINRWLTAEWRGQAANPVMIGVMLRNKRNRVFLVRWDGQPAGLVALADIDAADATAMVWYFLGDASLSGRGIITTALKLMAQRCIPELGLESLYGWAMADNAASIKVLHKAGFRPAGCLRRAANSNGQTVDRIYFDLLASECPAA